MEPHNPGMEPQNPGMEPPGVELGVEPLADDLRARASPDRATLGGAPRSAAPSLPAFHLPPHVATGPPCPPPTNPPPPKRAHAHTGARVHTYAPTPRKRTRTRTRRAPCQPLMTTQPPLPLPSPLPQNTHTRTQAHAHTHTNFTRTHPHTNFFTEDIGTGHRRHDMGSRLPSMLIHCGPGCGCCCSRPAPPLLLFHVPVSLLLRHALMPYVRRSPCQRLCWPSRTSRRLLLGFSGWR
jgi:hypothetical protein